MKKTIIFLLFILAALPVPGQTKHEPETVPVPPIPVEPFIFQEVKDNEQHYLKILNNETRVQLQSIKELDKDKYYELLQQAYFNSMEHFFVNKDEKEILKRQSKINELELKSEIIATKYKLDKKANKEKLESDLKSLLVSLFELKEKQRKEEIVRIEAELVKLKESIVVRKKNMDRIIDQRIIELLDKDTYLDWD